jgi:GTP-binding protein
VIDVGEDVAARFDAIDRELAEYGAGLDRLPQMVVLNKIDLVRPSAFDVADERIVGVFALSAATGEGVERFRNALFDLVPQPPAEAEAPLLPDFLVYRPRPRRERAYRILRTDRGFRIEGTPPDEVELEAALRAAGARKGVEVEVGDETFELA